jgi:hypothetical protein
MKPCPFAVMLVICRGGPPHHPCAWSVRAEAQSVRAESHGSRPSPKRRRTWTPGGIRQPGACVPVRHRSVDRVLKHPARAVAPLRGFAPRASRAPKRARCCWELRGERRNGRPLHPCRTSRSPTPGRGREPRRGNRCRSVHRHRHPSPGAPPALLRQSSRLQGFAPPTSP